MIALRRFLKLHILKSERDNEYFLHHRRNRRCRCGRRLSRGACLKSFWRNARLNGRSMHELRTNNIGTEAKRSWGEGEIFAAEALEGGDELTRTMKAILS